MKTTETCYKSKTIAQGTAAAINHDTLRKFIIYDTGNTQIFPAQGLGDGQRVGDEIFVTGIMIRCTFEMPYDRRNAKIKLWSVPYNASQGDPGIQAQFQHNVSGNTFVDPVQSKRWKGIKYLGMHQLRGTDQTTGEFGGDKTIVKKFWLPIYKKVTFTEDGSTIPASGIPTDWAIVATAYDTYSTFQTDTIVTRGEMVATLYYKDP